MEQVESSASSIENSKAIDDEGQTLKTNLFRELQKKQDLLVSGTSIKTLDGTSLLGAGTVPLKKLNGLDLVGSGSVDFKTLEGTSLIGTGTIDLKTVDGNSLVGAGAIDFKTVGGSSVVGAGAINFRSVNGTSVVGSGNISVTASSIGLDQVNNTSDANKPISTAVQNALNLISTPTFITKTSHVFPIDRVDTVNVVPGYSRIIDLTNSFFYVRMTRTSDILKSITWRGSCQRRNDNVKPYSWSLKTSSHNTHFHGFWAQHDIINHVPGNANEDVLFDGGIIVGIGTDGWLFNKSVTPIPIGGENVAYQIVKINIT